MVPSWVKPQGSHSPSPGPSSQQAWELYEHWEGHTCCLLGPNLTLGLLRRVPSLFACLQGTRIWAHLCTTRVLSLPHSRKLSIWGCSKDSEQENQRAPLTPSKGISNFKNLPDLISTFTLTFQLALHGDLLKFSTIPTDGITQLQCLTQL